MTTESEIDLDGHLEATGRKLAALLSAALAVAQAGAQIVADRARAAQKTASDLARQAESARRDNEIQSRTLARQAEQAAREAERVRLSQQGALDTLREKQWALEPSARWWHDSPQTAAEAWASADAHRATEPLAQRCAQRWEAVFTAEGINLDEVRAQAAKLRAQPETEHQSAASPATMSAAVDGEFAAEAIVLTTAAEGAIDVAAASRHNDGIRAELARPWTAYADGAPAARVGGQGVSKPPELVLASDRSTTGVAAASPGIAADIASRTEVGL